MTDVLDRFEEQLCDAARRLDQEAPASRSARLRRRWRLSKRSGLALAIVMTASGSAVAATAVWTPHLGGSDDPVAVSRNAGPPLEEAVDHLGVLRRQATPDDRDAAARTTLRYMSGEATRGVHTDYVRRLGDSAPGRAITLILVDVFQPPGRPALRDALCVFYSEPVIAGGGKLCVPIRDVLAGTAYASLGRRLFGLVPDGVAQVTVAFADGPLVVGRVRDNLFDVRAPIASRDPEQRTPAKVEAVTWQDASGHPAGPPAG